MAATGARAQRGDYQTVIRSIQEGYSNPVRVYDTVVNIEGDLRLEPKSIASGNMSEEQFSELYSKTIDIGLERIAPGLDYNRINTEVEQVIGFV